jgi:hypothetical protein
MLTTTPAVLVLSIMAAAGVVEDLHMNQPSPVFTTSGASSISLADDRDERGTDAGLATCLQMQANSPKSFDGAPSARHFSLLIGTIELPRFQIHSNPVPRLQAMLLQKECRTERDLDALGRRRKN